jgi:hypothetical protein
LQFVQEKEREILEKQIQQLFVEVISIWRDTDIKKNDAVRRLAARLEEYYIQIGQQQEIQTICRIIQDKLESVGLKTANHVKDYLEDKYKRDYTKSEKAIDGDILGNNLLSLQQVDLKQIPVDTKQKAFDVLSRFTDNIEKDAQQEHYALFKQHDSNFDNFNTQYQDRDDITTPKPEPKETELSDAIGETIDALGELRKDVIAFPPAYKQEAKIYSKGWQFFTKIIRWCTDDKFSLHPAEWLNKETYRQFQGKHAAAVWEKAETVLCVQCSKDLDNDPEAYEVMYADYRSPSGWKCIKCKGYEGILRGMTREQIGDRSVFIIQFAQDIINALPMLLDMFRWYDTRKKPYNSARKPILGPDLSKRA